MSRSKLLRHWDEDLRSLTLDQLEERRRLVAEFESSSLAKGKGRNPKAAREWRARRRSVEDELDRRTDQGAAGSGNATAYRVPGADGRRTVRARASDGEPSLLALADELRRRMAENPDFRHWYPTYRQLFGPFEDVPDRLRSLDETAIEPALRFLEADPWCFRSGYLKASLMRALAGGVPLTGHRRRIHRVLVARLRSPQPGLRKPAMTLAASVWDSSLDGLLTELSRKDDAELRDRVIDFRTGVAHRLVQRESAANRAANPAPTS